MYAYSSIKWLKSKVTNKRDFIFRSSASTLLYFSTHHGVSRGAVFEWCFQLKIPNQWHSQRDGEPNPQTEAIQWHQETERLDPFICFSTNLTLILFDVGLQHSSVFWNNLPLTDWGWRVKEKKKSWWISSQRKWMNLFTF